jgi:hypothetical protein
MAKTELPFQTVPFSNDGVQTLLAQARTDPALATLATTELQEHPRTTVTTLFRLSPKQLTALGEMDDSTLTKRIAPILARLKSGNLQGITLENPDGSPYMGNGGPAQAQPRPQPFIEGTVECKCGFKT